MPALTHRLPLVHVLADKPADFQAQYYDERLGRSFWYACEKLDHETSFWFLPPHEKDMAKKQYDVCRHKSMCDATLAEGSWAWARESDSWAWRQNRDRDSWGSPTWEAASWDAAGRESRRARTRVSAQRRAAEPDPDSPPLHTLSSLRHALRGRHRARIALRG